MPGRSAHTRRDAEGVRDAASRNGFARAFKRGVKSPGADALVARALEAGQRAWSERLGLARRAGSVAVGQAAASEAMRGDGWVLLLAEDAGDAAVRKFSENARRKQCRVVRAPGAFLGEALGREFVSVAVVARSPFSDALVDWADALDTYSTSVVRIGFGTDER